MSAYIEYDEATKVLAKVIVRVCDENKFDGKDSFHNVCIYCGKRTNSLKKMQHNLGCAVTMANNILAGKKYE